MPITIIPDTGINNLYVNPDTGNNLIISGSVGPLFTSHNSLINVQGGEEDEKYHISLEQYTNLATGSVIRPEETGIFYTRDNPSGYLSSTDLSIYVTGDVVRPSETGQFYLSSNPSGFITGINNLVFTTGDQIINGQKRFIDHLVIERNGNQLMLRTGEPGNTIFITTPAIFGNRTYTIPDVGHSCAFVMNDGPQTINGLKDFTTNPTFSGAEILSNRNIQITGELQSTVGVYAPNLTNIVYTVNDQIIGGNKTFTNNIISNGTDNLFLNEAGSSPHSLLTQQQLMLNGHKFRQLVNVNSKVVGTNVNTNAGAFQVLGMKASIAAAIGHSAACYTFDGLHSTDVSTAVMPINNEIDVFFHGMAMQFSANSNWIARINFGVPFSATVPLANNPATSSNRQWGVEFYYDSELNSFMGRLYYYFTEIIYGTAFVLPVYPVANAGGWAGFIHSIRMRQTSLGGNRLLLEFYINNSTSNNGGTQLLKNTPTDSLITNTIPAASFNFSGKHINFEVASSSTTAPTSVTRMQCNTIYCQFK